MNTKHWKREANLQALIYQFYPGGEHQVNFGTFHGKWTEVFYLAGNG